MRYVIVKVDLSGIREEYSDVDEATTMGDALRKAHSCQKIYDGSCFFAVIKKKDFIDERAKIQLEYAEKALNQKAFS